MKPRRIQRRRAKGWKMPPNTVYVGRPSRWGNPLYAGMFKGYTAADAVKDFRDWLQGKNRINVPQGPFYGDRLAEDAKLQLRGKNLACWCQLDKPCHADVLLEIANQ